ncbi:hypothetical protein KAT60_00090 [Candidatus Woesebacteria bacterium]|nr:hypothetical protein [Candidatus Woesebacteria bacterium]
MGEDSTEGKVDWVRGKEADLSKVSVRKIAKAHKKRGIEVESPAGGKGKSKITKKVIEGMPAPKSSKKG